MPLGGRKSSFFLLHYDFFKIVFAAIVVELVESFQNMSLVLALEKVLWVKNYE